MINKVKKIFTYNVIIIILFTAIFNVLYYKFIYTNLVNLTNLYVYNSLNAAAIAVESNIDKKINEVKLISSMDILKYSEYSLDMKLKFLLKFKGYNHSMKFYISDLEGIAKSGDGEIIYIGSYDFFNKAKKGITIMSEPIYNNSQNTWVTEIAVPITDAKGEILNILVAEYNVEELSELVNGIDLGKDTVTFIVSADGLIVTSNIKGICRTVTGECHFSEDEGTKQSLNSLKFKAIALKNGSSLYTYENKNMYAVFKTISNNNWILVASVPEKILYEKIYDITYIISFITLVVLFIAVCIVIYSNKLNKNLIEEKKKNRIVVNSSNILIVRTKNDGTIVDCNDNFINDVGYKKEELCNELIYKIISKEYINIFQSCIIKAADGINISNVDVQLKNKDGEFIYVLWNSNSVSDFKSEIIEFIGTNITKIKEYERKIKKFAYYDQLTKVYNAAYLEEHISKKIKYGNDNLKMALIYVDLDNFKYVNDMFGHNLGNKLIIDVCKRIQSIDDEKFLLCRNGGDEFTILYQDYSNNELQNYISHLSKAVKYDYYINNIKISVSASIGVSIYPKDGETCEELFKSADIAMNSAKELGKDRIKYFNKDMKDKIYEIINIDNMLKEAVKNKEFVLYYQPQYEISDGNLYGFEALIRWIRPEQNIIPPDKFIPQAEKNQLIIPIGDMVLEQACDFINEAVEKGYNDICVSVNVSVVQMMCDDYADRVINIINKKGVNTKNIKLEITESVMIESIEETLKKIKILNKSGIYFSLDDFGTGYSSLTYLKKIPIKILKIDKSFVDTIIDENENKKILSSIIELAHDIDLEVVAEGIEEDIQLEWLKSKGCNIAQGFFMGKPMNKEEAIKRLGSNMYNKS